MALPYCSWSTDGMARRCVCAVVTRPSCYRLHDASRMETFRSTPVRRTGDMGEGLHGYRLQRKRGGPVRKVECIRGMRRCSSGILETDVRVHPDQDSPWGECTLQNAQCKMLFFFRRAGNRRDLEGCTPVVIWCRGARGELCSGGWTAHGDYRPAGGRRSQGDNVHGAGTTYPAPAGDDGAGDDGLRYLPKPGRARPGTLCGR